MDQAANDIAKTSEAVRLEKEFIFKLMQKNELNTREYEDILTLQETEQENKQTQKESNKRTKTHKTDWKKENKGKRKADYEEIAEDEEEDDDEYEDEDEELSDEYDDDGNNNTSLFKISKKTGIEKEVLASFDKNLLKTLNPNAKHEDVEIDEAEIINSVPDEIFDDSAFDTSDYSYFDQEPADDSYATDYEKDIKHHLRLNKRGKWSVDMNEVKEKWSEEDKRDLKKYECEPSDVCLLKRLFRNPLSMQELLVPQLYAMEHEISRKYTWIFYHYIELATKVKDPLYVTLCQLFMILCSTRTQEMFYRASHEPLFRSFLSFLEYGFSELCKVPFEGRNILAISEVFVEPLRNQVLSSDILPGAHAACVHTIKNMSARHVTNVNPRNIVPGLHLTPEEYLPFTNSHICVPLLAPRLPNHNEEYIRSYMKNYGINVKAISWPENKLECYNNDAVDPIDLLVNFRKYRAYIDFAGFTFLCKSYSRDRLMFKGKNSKDNKKMKFEMPED